MCFRVLLFLCCFQIGFAQERVSVLLDSLAQATSSAEKTQLTLSIAEELQQSNWERTVHYLNIAKEIAQNSKDDKLIAEAYEAAGDIYSNKDALDIALENYIKAYEYYENKKPSQRFRLENLSLIHI